MRKSIFVYVMLVNIIILFAPNINASRYDNDKYNKLLQEAMDSKNVAKKLQNNALNLFNRVLEINPNSAEALYERACLQVRMQEFGNALADFNRLIVGSESEAVKFSRVYDKEYNFGRYNEARIAIENLIELEPNNPAELLKAAVVSMRLSKFDKALYYANKSIALNSTLEHPYYVRAQIFLILNRQEEANRDFAKYEELKFINKNDNG